MNEKPKIKNSVFMNINNNYGREREGNGQKRKGKRCGKDCGNGNRVFKLELSYLFNLYFVLPITTATSNACNLNAYIIRQHAI